ncbi:hypothetical protein LTR66_004266 [Elasticomyces elasticus]|nr:hypothetical protein LTR28_004020 [Elasticomyces elasticus]KAK4996041.1 hypothetical protein LTR66_004266 [Elasticomyces elasticus]
MSDGTPVETTDVVICGGGPTEAMLSAMLGHHSVSDIVLERETGITTDPRGIALDEDGIRLVQSVGLYDKIYSEIGSCMGWFMFMGGRHQDLSTKPFMVMNYNTTEGGTGHVGFICHKQPMVEKSLRSAISRYSCAQFRSRSTVTSISEDNAWAYITYLDADGALHKIRTKFVVGADGKTGFTRKKYLEPRGVLLQRASQTSYEEVWVALNWKMTLPTKETHPDFPLWALGYSPQDV